MFTTWVCLQPLPDVQVTVQANAPFGIAAGFVKNMLNPVVAFTARFAALGWTPFADFLWSDESKIQARVTKAYVAWGGNFPRPTSMTPHKRAGGTKTTRRIKGR
jgi:hypothetical protein